MLILRRANRSFLNAPTAGAMGVCSTALGVKTMSHSTTAKCSLSLKHDGVVSSFFTYTGPSDNNPWDEIDIEILGKDTEKVQFNYFTDGKGNHEYLHELGFDASEDFHTYAFEWHKDKIIWFVDGVEVYSVEESIPVTEGKIMMNVWNGIGVDSWLNAFDNSKLPLTAEYQWIAFTAFDE